MNPPVSGGASLPWYDLPATRRSLDAFWSVLRVELSSACGPLPCALDRTTPLAAQWSDPDLVISQCCGLDLFTEAGQQLVPIARPVFRDLDCEPGNYFSWIVARAGFRWQQGRVVINSRSSHSGCTALMTWMRARGWATREVHISGSHAASLEQVRDGTADLAAIDAHSWSLLRREGIEILGRSATAPAPAFVCHRDSVSRTPLLRALEQATRSAGPALGMSGVLPVGRASYTAMAREAGFAGRTTSTRLRPSTAVPIPPAI